MKTSLALPDRRHHITQKVRIAGQRTLYLNVHDYARPAEVFLRVKGSDCLALQYDAPLEKVGDLLADAKFALCGPIVGQDQTESSSKDVVYRCR